MYRRLGAFGIPKFRGARPSGARNFIAHGYDRIDYDVVWDTIAEDFPPLVTALEHVLSGESS